jgi:hypothetical protein
MKARKTTRAGRPRLKVNDRVLTPAQEASLRAAGQEAQAPDVAARAAAKLQALEAALTRDRAEAEVREGLTESLALARARGERVEQVSAGDPVRRVRVLSRDGLESLARGGAITGAQFAAGMLYRGLYEAADPERDLRSQLSAPAFLGAGTASAGAAQPKEAWAERRLRLSGQIAGVEEKVRVADRNGRAVRALREVAGHARCLSHFVKGGGGQAAYRQALVLALDVVAGHFGVG